jgi:hypothetical protein
MMPRSQLIFDKSNSVRSRTEKCKNYSHTLKLKNSKVIFITGFKIYAYEFLNSSKKLTLMDLSLWASGFDPHTKTNTKPLLVSPNSNPNKP